MAATLTHILPLTTLRRSRTLPARGRVLVRTGQKVNASDVIAEARLGGQHILLDVRRAFGVSRSDEADKLIQRRAGEKVQKDDIVAEMSGVFRKILRSPADGEIVAAYGGQVLIEIQNTTFKLKAGIAGVVTEIVPDYGAVIEGSGALIQGVWGNNHVEQGLLWVLARSPEEELTRARLDVSMRGAIVLAGTCADAESIKIAADLPLRGLILASMTPELIPVANSVSMPVLVIDGFGRLPMNSAAYRLLSTNEKRSTCVNAAAWNQLSGERPEIFIPLPAEGQPLAEMVEFTPGQTVRVHAPPYANLVGTLEQVRPGLTTLDNGLRAPVADVRLENNELVAVPLANLDVLG